MKSAFNFIPVGISFLWLLLVAHTLNPLILKGPDFITFYLLLLSGMYVSVLIGLNREKKFSKLSFYFLISVFALGIIKLIRGIYLGKPIGYLTMILLVEITVLLFVSSCYLNHKIK